MPVRPEVRYTSAILAMRRRGVSADEANRAFAEFIGTGEEDVILEIIFSDYQEMLESEIGRIYKRAVPLKDGGSIVIDQTEALVAIDVNSGSFRIDDTAEEAAYQLNLAAAKVARQLKLEAGCRLVTNNGRGAGQAVDHIHYHLLGGRPLGWPPG